LWGRDDDRPPRPLHRSIQQPASALPRTRDDPVNAFDTAAIVATFADDALVNDNHREFWGTDAIRAWV
jgi:ketosteroid isomerase-like protein